MDSKDSAPLKPAREATTSPTSTESVSPPASVANQPAISIQENSGNNIPEAEIPMSCEERPQNAAHPQEGTKVSFDDTEGMILPSDNAVPAAPPTSAEEGAVSNVDRVPPAVEQDGNSRLVDKDATLALVGGTGIEKSSQNSLEENSGDGKSVVDDTLQKQGSSAVESVEIAEKDANLGCGLSEDANNAISEDAGEKNAVAVELDRNSSLVDKDAALALVGGTGMENSSQNLSLEENYVDGNVVKVKKQGPLAVDSVESTEQDDNFGGWLSEEANNPVPENAGEKNAVQGKSSDFGVDIGMPDATGETDEASVEVDEVKGIGVADAEGEIDEPPVEVDELKDNGVPDAAGEIDEASVEGEGVQDNAMVARAAKVEVEEVGAAETDGSIPELKDEEDSTPVVAQSKNVEAVQIETSDNIVSERNIDVGEESQAQEAEAEGTQSTDSGDFNQTLNDESSSGEDLKSRNTNRNVLDTLGAKENETDEEVKYTGDGSQIVFRDEIMEIFESEEEEQEEAFASDGPSRVAILENFEAAKQILEEIQEDSSNHNGYSDFVHSGNYADDISAMDSDVELDPDELSDAEEIFDSATLAALLKAAAGTSPDDDITISSQDAGQIFSVERPAGLGSSVPFLKPAPTRSIRPSTSTPSELTVVGEDENMDEEERELLGRVEQIKVKFLRLVQRLGYSSEDTVAAQVLYRLGLAEGIHRGRQTTRSFRLENAKRKALQLEADGKDDFNFSCNILVLGKTGVGKSATINSIFGDEVEKAHTNAFKPATTYVKEISATLDGVKIRVIDTPGLRTSATEQSSNRKILSSIKRYTKRYPPDIVLYVDRLDTRTRELNDLSLLRSISSTLGSSIWFNAIVALTHAASAPPDGPNGSPLSYEILVAQRSHIVQQYIRQAAGDMRLMNPVALVENHPSCRRNKEGERVLPNGISWRPQLLLLCYSSKILSEANSLLKLQDPSPRKLFGFRLRSPPLPFLLSSLLQSREHPKQSAGQGVEIDESDIDLDDLSNTIEEDDDDEYDQLPPFKSLRKSQIAKLTKEQRKAYFDEYDYRLKLLQKKQWKEDIRRMKEMKKRGKSGPDNFGYGDMVDDTDDEGAPAAVPVPLPDMVLPPSFDCDNPAYRYRFLEASSQLLARPVLDTHGWDHDCGYDGVSMEQTLPLSNCFPAAMAVQITKDKKEFNIHLDSSISAKHGENGSTLAGFDIQTVGRQLAYILRGETKFNTFKKNKSGAGISVTFLGETVTTGLKIEDQISVGKRVKVSASTGAVRAQGDVAFGANMEVHLREKEYPIGQGLSTLGLSLMKWRSDLALGANLQSQFSVGRNSKVAVRVGLNNKCSGQITVKTSTSEQLQIALLGILPTALFIFRSTWPGEL